MQHNLNSFEAQLRQKFGKVSKSKGKKGLEFIVRCPDCGKRKLYINPSVGAYLCYKGCRSGSIRDLLQNLPDMQFQSAIPKQEVPLPTNVAPPGVLEPLVTLSDENPAIRYLRQRNFDPEMLDSYYGVRYCSQGRKFCEDLFDTTGTLIFPFYLAGKLIGWQARLLYNPDTLTDEECAGFGFPKDDDGDYVRPPKYLTNPGLQRRRVLFNFDWAIRSEVVVLCEGVFDAFAVGRCAVATLGKALSEQQLQVVKSRWTVTVALLDPDAEEEAVKLRESLGRSTLVVPVRLQGYKDPGEAPRAEIWAQIGRTAYAEGIDLLKYRIIV